MPENDRPVILTVDDEKGFRHSLKNYLEDCDYRVLEAGDGKEGLEIFEAHRPQLVLLDLRMPGIDGLEVLQRIGETSADTPVIVLSGAGVMDDVVEALRLGAWDYLLKPVHDVSVVQYAVEKALERARLIRENRLYQEQLEEEVTRRTKELRDIADALRQSEEKYRLLTENLKDVILSISPDGILLDVSTAVRDFGGYEPREEIGNHISKYFADKRDLVSVLKHLEDVILQQETASVEFLFKPKFRPPFMVEVTGKLLFENKKIVAILCSMRDISTRKKAELRMMESEQRFRDISYSMADWVWEVNSESKYTYASGKVKQVLGYEPEELVGRTPFDLMPENEGSRIGAIFQKIASEKRPIVDLENWHLTKSGELVCVLTNGVPILDKDGELLGYRGVDRNITSRKQIAEEKRKLEQQLQQARRMEAIGTLSGGIAHDFNNLLTVINGHAEIGLIKLDRMGLNAPESVVHKDLNAILQAGKRAEKLTRQLLTFSRKQVYEPKIINVNDTIRQLEKMLGRLMGEDISMRLHLASDVPLIKADPSQLEQILMNLLVNARDAVNERTDRAAEKKITIETQALQLDETFGAEHSDSRRGKHVLISVSDSGIGMSAEIKGKIFEPFFTTKPKGSGTGLGMATVYGIVKQNKAGIYVYSEPGLGTTFDIYWPASSESMTGEIPKKTKLGTHTGTERILLVEDEEAVRHFARDTLRELGYTIYEAENGKIALQLLVEKEIQIDLLLTDLIMPEMNGIELAAKVEAMFPTVGVLYASGYTDNHIKHTGVLDDGVHFIHKPYSFRDLAEKIREILDHW